MKRAKNFSKGFTLLELMVAMAVTSILLAGIYTTYMMQLKSQVTQQQIVEMQQNLRSAMYMMGSDIRMAGYNRPGLTVAGVTQAIGNSFAFTMDLNEDGDFVGPGPPPQAPDANEIVGYSLALNASGIRCLMRSTGGANQPVAEYIEALNFVYLDRAGSITFDPLEISSVQVTIVARSSQVVPVFLFKQTDTQTYRNQQDTVILAARNDNFRRMILTSDFKCRNLPI